MRNNQFFPLKFIFKSKKCDVSLGLDKPKSVIGRFYYNLIDAYIKVGNYTDALKYSNRELLCYQNPQEKVPVFVKMAACKLKLGKSDNEISSLLNDALIAARKSNSSEIEFKVLQELKRFKQNSENKSSASTQAINQELMSQTMQIDLERFALDKNLDVEKLDEQSLSDMCYDDQDGSENGISTTPEYENLDLSDHNFENIDNGNRVGANTALPRKYKPRATNVIFCTVY